MSKLVLSGDTSGSVTLDAPAVAGTTTLTLPTTSGTIVASDTSGNVGIGTTSPSAKLQVDAANFALSTSYATLTSNLAVRTTTAQAANVGGEIALGGYNDGSNISDFVRLHGKKLNSTSGNVSGYFAVEVSNDSAVAPYMFEQMRITNTGVLQFNSGYGSVATAFGCRAWVNFNGTGTVAIRASGNVTSITDNGTGDYTVNFTTNMPDADYSVNINASGPYRTSVGQAAFGTQDSATTMTVSAVRLGILQVGGTAANAYDSANIFVSVFR